MVRKGILQKILQGYIQKREPLGPFFVYILEWQLVLYLDAYFFSNHPFIGCYIYDVYPLAQT